MRRIPRLRRASGSLSSSSTHSASNVPRSSGPTASRHYANSRRPQLPYVHGLRCNIWGAQSSLIARRPYSSTPNIPENAEATEQAPAEGEWEAIPADFDIESEIAMPGQRQTAPRPDEVADVGYTPAQSSEELEEVGGLAGYFEDDSHWNPTKEIQVFGPAEKILDAAVLEILTRRAIVEALAVRDYSSRAERRPGLVDLWERGVGAEQSASLNVQVDVAEDGTARLKGDTDAVVSALTHDPQAQASEAAVELMGADEARALLNSWDPAWKRVSLEDAKFKFAVTKRIFQLTGHLIPDAKSSSIHTVRDLLAILVRPPKPKKLAEEIETRGDLLQLPNVKVYNRRVTPIDKDKMVGRWKVIVEELEKRELPVTGTGKHGKTVESKWVYPWNAS